MLPFTVNKAGSENETISSENKNI